MELSEFRNTLWDYVRYLRTSLDCLFRPLVEELGLTMLQARILVELQTIGEITVGDLGEHLGTGSGNVSTMCKRLEQLGYVTRERARHDERVVFISLTDEGREILNLLEKEIASRYERVISTWPQEDFELIYAAHKKVKEILSAMLRQSE
ncbi:MAG: MarR family transcriptional regulator [Firmicutes bacterium]|nr:MarR family transcriptional regulator [Bacillota bacterium]